MVWQRKQKHWQGLDLWFVAISEWLACCVRSSRLLASYPIEVIPNGLDLDQFRPTDKRAARQAWGLPQDRRIITYGAIRATQDPRKGYRELVAAIEKLKETGQTENLLLVVFGDPTAADLPGLHIENRNVGYVDDDRSLSLLYSAADVAVVPSIEEAFGKTVIEAMACATPVVAFNTGGPKDIITHQHDGFLAEPFRPDDLATGVAWCLDRVRRGPEFGRQARAKVEAKFDIEVVAASYERLYRRILARARPGVYA
jgi:glycosyltransferase involved in cell wall biosynthesis